MQNSGNNDLEYVRSKLEKVVKQNFPNAGVSAGDALDTIRDKEGNSQTYKSSRDVNDFHVKPKSSHTIPMDSNGNFSYDVAEHLVPMKLVNKALKGASYDIVLKEEGFTVRGNAAKLAEVLRNEELSHASRVGTAADRNRGASANIGA